MYLNCSTACPQPLKLGLETPVDKELVSEGDTWKLFKLKNVDSDNSPLCFSNCPGQEQTSAIASLTVYGEYQAWGPHGDSPGKSHGHLRGPWRRCLFFGREQLRTFENVG